MLLKAGVGLFCLMWSFGVMAEVTRIVIQPSPETTEELIKKYPSLHPIFQNIYPPRVSEIVRKENLTDAYNLADSYGNEEWLKLSPEEKGEYLMKTFGALNKLHGFNYSPRIMTCLTYRESTFRPQLGAYSADPEMPTTAQGLTMVTRETAVDMMDRFGFQSKLYGFIGAPGEEYFQSLPSNMILQMEAGLGVMWLKNNKDTDPENILGSLRKYYGSSSSKDHDYAQAVYDCAICIRDKYANKVKLECLQKAKSQD